MSQILHDRVFGNIRYNTDDDYWYKSESCSFYGLVSCQVEIDIESKTGVISQETISSYTYFSKRWNKPYLFDSMLQYKAFTNLFKFCEEHSKKVNLQTGVDWYTANSYDTVTPEVVTGDNHLGGETIHHGPRNTLEAKVYAFFDMYTASNVVFKYNGDWGFIFVPRNIKDPNWFGKLKYSIERVSSEPIRLEYSYKSTNFKTDFIK